MLLSHNVTFVLATIISVATLNPINPSKAQTDEVFNFAAAGDWGCTPNTSETVKNMIGKDAELIIGLGDYSYKDTQSCWLEMIKPLINKTQITLGNHDMNPLPKLVELVNMFDLIRPYESFDYRNVHFTTFSTEYPTAPNGTQYAWLENDLMKATNSATDLNKWIVVFFHQPAYTSKENPGPVARIAKFFHPLFEEYGVDLVLQAHVHFYERTYPILPGPKPTLPIVTNYNRSIYNNPEGQIFAIVGTGGANLFDLETKPSFIVSQYSGHGFLDVEINGTRSLTARFYANNETIIDQFSIINQR